MRECLSLVEEFLEGGWWTLPALFGGDEKRAPDEGWVKLDL